MPDEHLRSERRRARLVTRARRGDERAREALVRDLLPVAERVARRFASPQHPLEDLAQVAGIGLLKAIERFNPAREAALVTYAQALMTGEVRRHLRDSRLLRIPRPIYEQVPRFRRTLDRLTADLRRTPTRRELAEALGVSAEELIEIADAAFSGQPVSLDVDEAFDTPSHEPGFDQVEAEIELAPMLRRLSARARMVLDLRFEDGLSQGEIAAGLGLSQTQVSRILRGAIGKLSKHAPAVA
jgi:RNA polymerase sigma-B factor